MMKETGFIFAAGLGTRLKPITNCKPKALVKLDGRTLLDGAIGKFAEAGIQDVIVNVHHFPDLIINHIKSANYNINIRISDERAYLRETAGGLKFASPFWSEKDLIVIYNVDIDSSIDLRKLVDYHILNGNDATLAVRHRKTSRYLLFDDDDKLCGWENESTDERIILPDVKHYNKLAFSGIHVINTSLAEKISSVEKESVTKFYLNCASDNKISGYIHDNDTWSDVGKTENFVGRLS